MNDDADNGQAPGSGQPDRGASAGAGDEAVAARFGSLLATGVALVEALQRLLTAWSRLAAAEAKLALAGISLFIVASIALVAFSVSLWACAVALAGWLLMLGTHSLGIALGLLIVIHAALIVATWVAIKRGLRLATLPQTRAELRSFGRSVLGEIRRNPDSASAAADRSATRAAPRDKAA